MSPDAYLQFAAAFISYFVKIAVAYLLCRVLAWLANSPRRRFAIWLSFMFAALGYWFYVLGSSFTTPELSAATAGRFPRIAHQFLLPIKFQKSTMVLGRVLGWAYVVGVLLLFTAGIWKRVRLYLLLRQGTAPSSELRTLFSGMCRHFGVRHCELIVLPKVSSPATVYWWRPRILLPQVCSELDDSSAMADILYHELAHVARRDYFWSSINDLICRLLFFHPAVWQARKQMAIHREMACDLAVVAARPEHRIDYAQTLTRVARLCLPRKHSITGIDFAAAPSLLTHRIHAILNVPAQISRVKSLARAVAGVALMGTYGFLCALAVAIAFAPASEPGQSAEVQAAPKTQARFAARHRIAGRGPISPADEQSLITESPAYRLTTSSGEVKYAPALQANAESGSSESMSSNIPGWRPLHPGSGSSAGRTIESVIVATVGTVIGIDKEERKHKDGSSSSSHFQDSATLPGP